MDSYLKTWRSIHRSYELWLRDELRKACSYMDANGRWDRMMVSLSEETLQAYKQAADYAHSLHLKYDGDTTINKEAWKYHADALSRCEVLLDGLEGINGIMTDIHGIRIAEIPLFVIRCWLQEIEDICLLSRWARNAAVK